MRALAIVLAVLGLWSASVHAAPRVAVAHIKNDGGDELHAAIAEALGDDARVIPIAQVKDAMDRLGLSGDVEGSDVVKLTTKLRASVLVQGKVTNGDGERILALTVTARGKKPVKVVVQYKKVGSTKFKSQVHDELVKHFAGGDDDDEKGKEDKEREARLKAERANREKAKEDGKKHPGSTKVTALERKPKKTVATADPDDEKDPDDAPKKMMKRVKKEPPKPPKEDPPPPPKKKEEPVAEKPRKKKKVEVAESDPPPKKKKKKKRVAVEAEAEAEVEVGDSAPPRNVVLMPAARVNAGLSAGVRKLDYTRTGTGGPPPLGTGAGGGRVEGELYPLAFGSPNSGAAGIGIGGEYDMTVGLRIQIPNTNTSVPIDQGHYGIGGRYRFAAGSSAAIVLSADYVKRHYLANNAMLDAPDVDYTAVAPGIAARIAATPTVALFAHADGLLIMDTGPIQKGTNYGKANVLGFEGTAGVDIGLGTKFALRLAGEYSEIDFSFSGTGAMAKARGVSGASDRQFGIAATLGVLY